MSLLCLFLHICFAVCISSKRNRNSDRNPRYPHPLKWHLWQQPDVSHVSPHLNHKHDMKHVVSMEAGIYGIGGTSYADGEGALIKYDTMSGNASTVAIPNTRRPPYTAQGLSCFDNIHHILFVVYEHLSRHGIVTALYPFDLQNTTALYDPILLPIASNPGLAGDQCISDPNSGDIFVFGHDGGNALYQLLLKVSFDPKSKQATITQIGNYSLINDIPLLNPDINIYDSKRDMLWLTGDYGNNESDSTIDYFYINAKTGDIENRTKEESPLISSGVYNPNIDRIVGVDSTGYNEKGDLELKLFYADPTTLETVRLFDAVTEVDWRYYENVYTLDIDGGIFYQIIFANASADSNNGTLLGHLVAIDIYNGTVVAQPSICEMGETDTCPWYIQYWDGN